MAGAIPEIPQREVLTADMVAREYFRKELEHHSNPRTKTAVIVHDSCYGHRFSRPRTSKAALSTIVERPERIHATLLGASSAYVRLGGRHSHGRHPPHPSKRSPPESVPFEIRKTSRFVPLHSPFVTQVHGTKWMEELQIMCDSAESKLAMNSRELARPIGYGKDENGNALPRLHEGDLYLCAESLAALQGCLGGVCDAIDTVFGNGPTERAFVCIRPPGHHCSSNYPSGFCWLNNVHVGITYGAMHHGLTHAAIIDFDLHHGDGSQSIAWSHNSKAQELKAKDPAHRKTPIGYYSLHDINSYPCEWGDEEKVRNASVCLENAHGQSIWNVHLEPWKTHQDFWALYESRYSILLHKARNFLQHHSNKLRSQGVQPKAAIFLSAGFDASEWEGAGMQRHAVNVPTDFYARFTADVVKMSQEEATGVDGRIISVLEGGYSDRALTSGVLSHLCGLVDEPSTNITVDTAGGLASSLSAQSINQPNHQAASIDRYDAEWWSRHSLETVEAIVAGNLPPPPKPNDKISGNYSSPTQASTARMTEVARERRSLSAQLEARLLLENEPPVPPPDVDWAVGAYELSRLIIPSDRQTLSCRPDELNAEATKARRDRQSAVGVSAIGAGEPMQLRERRAKAVPLPAAVMKSSSRNENRRTTIASVNDLPDPTLGNNDTDTIASGRPRRRSSAASSIVSGFKDMQLNEHDNGMRDVQRARRSRSGTRTPTETVKTKGEKPAAAVKKAKPTTAKASTKTRTSPRRTSPRRVAPLPELPQPPSSTSDQTVESGQHANTTGQMPHNDVDNVTNGVKKLNIKLKVPTAEEHAAKQKAGQANPSKKAAQPKKQPAARVTKPKPTTKAPAAKDAVDQKPELHQETTNVTGEAEKEVHISQLSMNSNQNALPEHTTASGQMEARPQGVMAISSVVNRSSNASKETSIPAASENSVAEADETSNSVPGSEPLASHSHLMTESVISSVPTASAETAKEHHIHQFGSSTATSWPRPATPNNKTRADLPVFTSSSPIPFAKRDQMKQEPGKPTENINSIWDVPATPQQ